VCATGEHAYDAYANDSKYAGTTFQEVTTGAIMSSKTGPAPATPSVTNGSGKTVKMAKGYSITPNAFKWFKKADKNPVKPKTSSAAQLSDLSKEGGV
jgi:hypothetical protein